MFQKVLVATDGSDNAQKAVEYALKLSQHHPEAEIILINAYNTPPVAPEYTPHWKVAEAFRDRSKSILDKAAEPFAKENRPVQKVSVEGDPGQVICAYAREQGCDHIIVGAVGVSGLAALLFGSVARKVTQLAHCPVTVIH